MINLFNNDNTDFNYLLDSIGQDVLLNDSAIRALITNRDIGTVVDFDDKNISTLEPIKRGDMVTWNDKKYLIITETEQKRYTKYKAIMRHCNYSIKFVIDGELYEFDAIIESESLYITNGVISFPMGKIVVTLQENEDTLKLELGKRFIKMGFPWQITGIDRSKKGLVILKCDIDVFKHGDDEENEIADADQLVTWSIAITNTDTTISKGDKLQLNVVVKKNDAVVTEPVVFESSDPSIASVNTSGLVTAHEEGYVTITVRLERDTNIFDTILLEVEEKIEKYIIINGKDTIVYNSSQEYTAYSYVGNKPTYESVNWTIVEGSSRVQIISLSDLKIKLKATSSSGTVILQASLKSDPTIKAEKRISLSLF